MVNNDKYRFMEYAYNEAVKAFNNNEVPIGAVLVYNDKIISKAYNKKNKSNLSCNHAELLCINKASKKLNNWRLDDCIMYVTLEPCPMCASLIHQSRVKKVYYAIKQNDINNFNIISSIFSDSTSNKATDFEFIDCGKKYSDLLSEFFKKRR